MTSVAVGCIHDAFMDARFVRCLTGLNLARRQGQETLYVESGGGSLDRGRNLLVQKFLQNTDDDWLLFVDTDMFFGVGHYDRLLSTAQENDYPMLSGLYYANEQPPRPAMYRFDEDGRGKSLTEWNEGEVVEVDGHGAGFLLVHRSVYREMDHPDEYRGRAGSWFTQDALGPAGQLGNEDDAFCWRAKAHGFQPRVDTGCMVGHIKPRVLGVD